MDYIVQAYVSFSYQCIIISTVSNKRWQLQLVFSMNTTHTIRRKMYIRRLKT